MKTFTIYQVDSFTTEKFTGNPAGVVSNADGLTETQMQMIARELNNSETAFIFKPVSEDGLNKYDVQLRFFTPTMEVPMCGHATIAAHYVRAVEEGLESSRVIQKVQPGILPVDIVKNEGDYKIIMTQSGIVFDQPLDTDITQLICEALGISASDLEDNAPIQIVSTGHSKVMICIKSYEQLKQLTPDFEELIEISHSLSCNGYLVFTKESPEKEYFINARMFGPALGINEDPVNGSSGGALGAYLIRHGLIESFNKKQITFKVRQGFSANRLGTVEVVMDIDEQGKPLLGKIIGDAVIIFKTSINL